METRIFGYSDDTICVEGEVDDEVDCTNHKKPVSIKVSDGTIATIFFDGEWKIKVVEKGSKYIELVCSIGFEDKHNGKAKGCSSYSDAIIFSDGIDWVKVGRKILRKP